MLLDQKILESILKKKILYSRYNSTTKEVEFLIKEDEYLKILKIAALLITSRMIDFIKEKYNKDIHFYIRKKIIFAYLNENGKRILGRGDEFFVAINDLFKNVQLYQSGGDLKTIQSINQSFLTPLIYKRKV